jgi:hypothetical protein
MLHHLHLSDVLKDSTLALLSIIPIALTQTDIALIFGVLNLLFVGGLRLFELRRRERRDTEMLQLRARVRELEDGQGSEVVR